MPNGQDLGAVTVHGERARPGRASAAMTAAPVAIRMMAPGPWSESWIGVPAANPQAGRVAERAQRLAETFDDAPGEREHRVAMQVVAEPDVAPVGRPDQPHCLLPVVEPERMIVEVVKRVAVVVDHVPPEQKTGDGREPEQRRVRAEGGEDAGTVQRHGRGEEREQREVAVPLGQVGEPDQRRRRPATRRRRGRAPARSRARRPPA